MNCVKIFRKGKIRFSLPWKCHNLLFIVLIYREEEAFIPRLAFRDRILCSCIHHFLLLFSFYHLNICHLQFDYENICLYSKENSLNDFIFRCLSISTGLKCYGLFIFWDKMYLKSIFYKWKEFVLLVIWVPYKILKQSFTNSCI